MSRGLRYSDAVTLLGGSGPLLRAADRAAGTALTLATAGGSDLALSLFDARSEAVKLSEATLGRLADSVRGLKRYDRTQRLQAAHGVLVVTGFFAALDECLAASGVEAPGFSRDDQLMLAAARSGAGWVSALLDAELPVPSAERTAPALLRDVSAWSAAAGSRLLAFLSGLAEWDRADSRARRALADRLAADLPGRAASRYLESARRLAGDLPEFDLWLGQLETHAVGRGLEQLETLLRQVGSRDDPSGQRAALASAYRAVLHRPVLGGEVRQPSLGDAYIDPRFQVKAAGPGARPADDSWWDAGVRSDFGDFLATFLTTPAAAEAPMLLLGQPGAGKSTLTRILAARLPADAYLVIRVALREVRAESEIQDQIEQAIRAAIGETVSWPALARDAGAAQPLILLDGFDELLQATGIHQSDYLQRVAEFQRREADLGRPVAIIVTSRVAVADRARLPEGAPAVRLEAFDEAQTARWREFWNAADPSRRPLSLTVLRRFPDLAAQPLLLLMLALFDASTSGLADYATLDTGQLYERLLSEFARREVTRGFTGPDAEVPRRVERELLRLSVVAFAMFHRGRLWVTEAELDNDLAGLGLSLNRTADGFRTPLTAGQEMVGRFFFVQRAQALRDGQQLRTYEFLHATFGEYLVARLTVQALHDAVARDAAGTLALQPRDDDLLSSLLGYTPLTARATVLPFVTGLIDGPAVRPWLIEHLRSAVLRPQWAPRAYRPVDRRSDFWTATYSFNLALLVLACGTPLRASELWQYSADPAYWMRITARLWTAAVPSSMWLDSLAPITVTRAWSDDRRRDIVLSAAGRAPATRVDLLWSHRVHPDDDPGPALSGFHDESSFDVALRAMALDGYLSTDLLRHALEPLIETMPSALTEVVVHGPGDASSVARALLDLWLAGLGDDDERLATAYARAVAAITATRAPGRATAVVQASLTRDADRLPPGLADRLRTALPAPPLTAQE